LPSDDEHDLDAALPASLRAQLAHLSEQRREGELQRLLATAADGEFSESPAVNLRASIALTASDPARAQRYASRAVSLAPTDAAVLTRAGFLFYEVHNLEAAENCVRTARSYAEESFDAWPSLLHLAGLVKAARGDDAAAEPLLRLAFEGAPQHPGFGQALLESLLRQGEFTEAREVAATAIRARPDDQQLRRLAERTG
jgi:Tfp pilus assembly protein PilF